MLPRYLVLSVVSLSCVINRLRNNRLHFRTTPGNILSRYYCVTTNLTAAKWDLNSCPRRIQGNWGDILDSLRNTFEMHFLIASAAQPNISCQTRKKRRCTYFLQHYFLLVEVNKQLFKGMILLKIIYLPSSLVLKSNKWPIQPSERKQWSNVVTKHQKGSFLHG